MTKHYEFGIKKEMKPLTTKQKLLIVFGWVLLAFYAYTVIGVSIRVVEQLNNNAVAEAQEAKKPRLANPEEYLILVNEERAKAGVQPLVMDSTLNFTASKKSADMISKGYYQHDAPNGQRWYELIRTHRPSPAAIGENLAECFNDKRTTFQAWMQSTTHMNNLLNSKWVYYGSHSEINPADGCMIVVNHFSS